MTEWVGKGAPLPRSARVLPLQVETAWPQSGSGLSAPNGQGEAGYRARVQSHTMRVPCCHQPPDHLRRAVLRVFRCCDHVLAGPDAPMSGLPAAPGATLIEVLGDARGSVRVAARRASYRSRAGATVEIAGSLARSARASLRRNRPHQRPRQNKRFFTGEGIPAMGKAVPATARSGQRRL